MGLIGCCEKKKKVEIVDVTIDCGEFGDIKSLMEYFDDSRLSDTPTPVFTAFCTGIDIVVAAATTTLDKTDFCDFCDDSLIADNTDCDGPSIIDTTFLSNISFSRLADFVASVLSPLVVVDATLSGLTFKGRSFAFIFPTVIGGDFAASAAAAATAAAAAIAADVASAAAADAAAAAVTTLAAVAAASCELKTSVFLDMGMRYKKEQPLPSPSLNTSILPPCNSTIDLEMCNPNRGWITRVW